ncbi:MAG TPA: class I SAM-dependent methyltransferase [Opitutaceae bacterium]|jgi:SAM-dependent methyltransferase|nr:class I SAM-dependent methyltransferase [Opitutaceae bacterium]
MSEQSELNDHNKSAWNDLYASTSELVWGREPVGFLATCLPEARALPAGPVLDAAAGEGRNLSVLLRLGREVTACDASSAALAKIPAEPRRRVTTTVCDLSSVPFPDRHFALILLSDAVETLPDPRPVLTELFRLLAPGGCLLANAPEHDDGVAKIEMEPAPGGGSLYQGRYYYHFYTRAEAEALFTARGFEIAASHDCRWEEPPHPHFRDRAHRHHSRVILARRPA